MGADAVVEEISPCVYWIKSEGRGSHSYVIRGDYKNVLIDSGEDEGFSRLQAGLAAIGLKVRDIDIVINTHEHFDHIGANRYFQEHTLIAAHRLAATKLAVADRFVTMYRPGDLNDPPLRVHLWLENRFRFDLGNFNLLVLYTPGHTSGSICLYEMRQRILFTGDTLFAGGTLSYIAESGSIGDYINSIGLLATVRIDAVYPGHGAASTSAVVDMAAAISNANAMLAQADGVDALPPAIPA